MTFLNIFLIVGPHHKILKFFALSGLFRIIHHQFYYFALPSTIQQHSAFFCCCIIKHHMHYLSKIFNIFHYLALFNKIYKYLALSGLFRTIHHKFHYFALPYIIEQHSLIFSIIPLFRTFQLNSALFSVIQHQMHVRQLKIVLNSAESAKYFFSKSCDEV